MLDHLVKEQGLHKVDSIVMYRQEILANIH